MRCIDQMRGGEVFVPKIPSMRVIDLAEAVAPECEIEYVGIRPGEKVHESLISPDEARTTIEMDGMYVIQPPHPWFRGREWQEGMLPDGFQYTSDANESWLSVDELRKMSDQV